MNESAFERGLTIVKNVLVIAVCLLILYGTVWAYFRLQDLGNELKQIQQQSEVVGD